MYLCNKFNCCVVLIILCVSSLYSFAQDDESILKEALSNGCIEKYTWFTPDAKPIRRTKSGKCVIYGKGSNGIYYYFYADGTTVNTSTGASKKWVCDDLLMKKNISNSNIDNASQPSQGVESVIVNSVINSILSQDLNNLASSAEEYSTNIDSWQCNKCGVLARQKKQPLEGGYGGCNAGKSSRFHNWRVANSTQGYQCKKCSKISYLVKRKYQDGRPSGGELGDCIQYSHYWIKF
jgi:hypothetical protein